MLNVLVVGAGQIGSRHLQGLVSVRLNLNIIVVDISNFSLDLAKLRWGEAGGNQSHHKIDWCKKIPGDIKNIDLAIVTTSSLGRATLVEQLVLSVNVNYWVFEKVLAQSRQELELIEYATSNAKNAWVNTPRRLMTWYQKLKIEFNNKGSLKIKKSGGLWGLACNSIHYIDLVNWWTGESLFSVNTRNLDKIWLKSKRLGYFEVSGELLIKFSGGTQLILQSYPNKVKDIIHIVLNDKKNWIINEQEGVAYKSKKEILSGKVELQSEMTGRMVTKILIEGTCNLPHLKESSKQHAIFLDAMLSHWNTCNKSNDKAVPIT